MELALSRAGAGRRAHAAPSDRLNAAVATVGGSPVGPATTSPALAMSASRQLCLGDHAYLMTLKLSDHWLRLISTIRLDHESKGHQLDVDQHWAGMAQAERMSDRSDMYSH